MKSRACSCLVVMVILILICGNAYAVDDEQSRNSLRGLTGIVVVVEPPNRQVALDGLTEGAIKAPVEIKFRQAEITVVSIERIPKELPIPLLYINANVAKLGTGEYIYNVLVEFRQSVTLVRSPRVRCPAATWSTACLGRTTEFRDIQETIQEGVAKFITAYLSVNPKK
jgi:hypothetical protein